MIEHLGQQLTVLVEELRTVGDPEAAEAQIESVSSEAAEQVAAANASAPRAEQALRRAEAQKDEADAAAEEATRANEETAQDLVGARQDLDAARIREEQLAVELADSQASAVAERDRSQAENTALLAELESVRAQLASTVQDRDAATDARAQLEAVRTDLDAARDAAGDMRSTTGDADSGA